MLSLAGSATPGAAERSSCQLSAPLLPIQDPDSAIFSPQPEPDPPSLEAARQYEQLMDSHSLHEFMIRYGQTLNTTPEFMSYQRVYAAVWPVLAELILQLEGICAEYAIPLVVVDGKVCCF